ncbi:Poly(A)+ RNA export protein [Pseudogymnoascus verrucosus]|uniref:Poly(A)+ RNA export protein n=1 Tax=Pseudogymnoascus verrucosus TaxID=342668 RepID=A0A1B8GI97_9PEZI|nr:Poly(A)+ RNA export protein [Pseudogymnoascus verrucosus]OBT95525.1 Poly(A)+ RNA export protein [Pseudogymnoascus verrucosus]
MASSSNVLGQVSTDTQLANGPDDGISGLSWSPLSRHLAVASWEGKVRIYDMTHTRSGEGRALIDFGGPALSCSWSKDGQKVIGAGADKAARLLDLASNGAPPQQVAAHDAPISSVHFFTPPSSNAPMIVTGSWDKTIKYWDLRQQSAVASVACQERVYSMDVKGDLLVTGTADRHINIIKLDNPTTFHQTLRSPLHHQTRVVSCFNDANGFAIGSIEGRCAFRFIDKKDTSLNFTFKCHRSPPANNITTAHAVNAISFHPQHGTFSTAGSDGTFHFWDKDTHMRIRAFPSAGGSISATAFSGDGGVFAYAVSYDWSKGYAGSSAQVPNKVMLHAVGEEECKPKGRGGERR